MNLQGTTSPGVRSSKLVHQFGWKILQYWVNYLFLRTNREHNLRLECFKIYYFEESPQRFSNTSPLVMRELLNILRKIWRCWLSGIHGRDYWGIFLSSVAAKIKPCVFYNQCLQRQTRGCNKFWSSSVSGGKLKLR